MKIMKLKDTLGNVAKAVNGKVQSTMAKASLAISSFLIALSSNSIVHAEDSTGFLKGSGNSAFSSLNKSVESTGASIYSLMKSGAIIALVIGIVTIGIGMAVGGGNKRAEKKADLLWWVIGGVLIFGATAMIVYVEAIGSSM